MKKKYQNAFFVFGIIILVFMTSQLNFSEVAKGLRHAGIWFVAVVILWAFLYLFNTSAWWIIIRSQEKKNSSEDDCEDKKTQHPALSFWHLYKLTISGFALNDTTPSGLMGGEPYRIMSLKPYIGIERATSSVLLYAMTHIFSHLWFWLLSVFLYISCRTLTLPMVIMLTCIAIFCCLNIWFFMSGYRKGLAMRILHAVKHIPGLRRKMTTFICKHHHQLNKIDRQIAALHRQNHKTFLSAILLELCCRIASALEIFFILLVLMPSVNFIDCILILAFTSLLANLLFFLPLQLGGREGGFLLSATALSMSASDGIFIALIVRLRELLWVAIGLIFIKLEKKK